jgi:hypothetical protein
MPVSRTCNFRAKQARHSPISVAKPRRTGTNHLASRLIERSAAGMVMAAETSAKHGKRQGFSPSGGAWKPYSARAKSVGEFVPALMRPAFEKYGFPAAAILTDWAAIAGAELAAYTAPERLKWPRKPTSDTDGGRQAGATLILRVDGPRALEVEHLRPRLIERINASFGYRAVADIRVLQAPLIRRDAPKKRAMAPAPASIAVFTDLREDRVRQALARIAAGIEAARQNAVASPRF